MKAICPKDANHKEFITVAHVTQDWKVDERGEYLEVIETLETTHGPNTGNTWTCNICGEEAIVED